MTVKECYEQMGSDYEGVLGRMGSEAMIKRFALKFLQDPSFNNLKENLEKVEENIQAACDRAGRKRDEVTLIAVSKTKPPHMLQEAYDLGVRIFGENKVQEIQRKYPDISGDVRWHLIGTLQTNKVKYIADKVDMIHSLDRIELAKEINRQAVKHNRIIKCLIQVKISEEDTKHGVDIENVIPLVRDISDNYPNIIICGLMGMAP